MRPAELFPSAQFYPVVRIGRVLSPAQSVSLSKAMFGTLDRAPLPPEAAGLGLLLEVVVWCQSAAIALRPKSPGSSLNWRPGIWHWTDIPRRQVSVLPSFPRPRSAAAPAAVRLTSRVPSQCRGAGRWPHPPVPSILSFPSWHRACCRKPDSRRAACSSVRPDSMRRKAWPGLAWCGS
ncbi:hypothetical protein LZ31DRAFT_58606 [Colletotrichum somersetense]|nr:hypothetical protein LZ31DRAFT_58606 [Colletotrichum somersetense]